MNHHLLAVYRNSSTHRRPACGSAEHPLRLLARTCDCRIKAQLPLRLTPLEVKNLNQPQWATKR